MSIETPVRNPDLRSREVMTRRAWFLVALNFLMPGSAQIVAGSRRLGRVGVVSTLVAWAVAIVAVGMLIADRALLLDVATNSIALWAIALALVYFAGLWIVLTLDTLRLVRLVRLTPLARPIAGTLAIVSTLAASGIAGYGASSAFTAASLFSTVFGSGSMAAPVDGRYNILLLGGDAGPDRVGLRPDSLSVASVDAASGQVTLFGIPRNLYNAPFSEGSPMYGPYPDGYTCGDDCLIDYIYTYASQHPELYPGAADPGAEAMRDAAEGVLGLKIQYYLLIDMHGFRDLIDALGGIEIDVKERLPYGSNDNPDGSPRAPDGWIEAGLQRMDGKTALWYGRTRYGTTDYQRMARQREVQQAIIAQMDPATVISRFGAIAEAGKEVVRTDMPQSMLSLFVRLAPGATSQKIVTLDFVPPKYSNVHPNFGKIHVAVQALLHPAK